jgi:hypothetical protein
MTGNPSDCNLGVNTLAQKVIYCDCAAGYACVCIHLRFMMNRYVSTSADSCTPLEGLEALLCGAFLIDLRCPASGISVCCCPESQLFNPAPIQSECQYHIDVRHHCSKGNRIRVRHIGHGHPDRTGMQCSVELDDHLANEHYICR